MKGLDLIMNLFKSINKYLEVKAPWKSIKEDKSQGSEAATTLYVSAEDIKNWNNSQLLLLFQIKVKKC